MYLTIMKFPYIIFIFVVLQNALIKVDGLSPSKAVDWIILKDGDCTKIVSFLASYEQPYLETYKETVWGIFYKTRTRWNYKIQYRVSTRQEHECCAGYAKIRRPFVSKAMISVCEPICRPDCGNGTCVKPNVCNCNNGYRSETALGTNVGCAPVCTHACVHGKCVAPEICKCDFGYKLSDNSYICEPVCSEPCGTGSFCYKPYQCLCLKGYKMINSDSKLSNMCQPICERECVHGKCTAPETCTCNHGYEPDPFDIFACKPTCEPGCLYGKCTAPNVCTCNEGYSLKTPNVCAPICSEACVMGTCVAPESCSCLPGYGLLENSKYICEPVCEKACVNGRCTTPGECTCEKGYLSSGDETEKHICKPHCEISCQPFGKCTAPNVCTCIEGYRLVEKPRAKKKISSIFNDYSVCEPVCHLECINGFCSAPNTCSCNIGYLPSGKNSTAVWCTPTCRQKCVNGFCSAPDTCTCNADYRPSNSTNVCKPFCATDCINGHCTAPNECTCNPGYRPTEGNRTSLCEPVCDPSCENGICVKPDVCSCNPGYLSTNPKGELAKVNTCDPICHPACGTNGICKAPDLCVCKDGYRMVYYDAGNIPFECTPICRVECGNGTCAAPDHCVCFDGYRNAKTGRCEPVCGSCGNGTCVAPEVCECDDGFGPANLEFGTQESRNSIIPENSTGNGSRCVPHCENCDNGECEAPGECRCHAGFVEIVGTCVHACQGGCGTHGECIEERKACECNYGWAGLHCDRPTLCVLILNDEGNRTEQLTVVKELNATIKHILINNPVCSQCIGKVNNETLCFNMLINGTKDETQVGCLMNEECLASSSQYKGQEKIIQLSSGIACGILFLTAITIYLIVRKRRNRQTDLGSVETIYRHSTSMQGLIQSSANNS